MGKGSVKLISIRSPAFDLVQTRMVFALRRDKFHYMAITDEKQRVMPMPEDLLPGRGKQLIFPYLFKPIIIVMLW
ncbi:hypothetical protein DKX38_016797 [Salix brachista]|uniref:Uncharacterized protein n=1 Tax=Salix brachista TaxID=2182728 RepID=A0A5N5KUD4_9ROSI|nr:hypothetical protein DKX38_016797 [Salix brachista]